MGGSLSALEVSASPKEPLLLHGAERRWEQPASSCGAPVSLRKIHQGEQAELGHPAHTTLARARGFTAISRL